MKIGTLTVSGGKFRLPCVYEFIREGVVIYVGRSDAGFSRAFRGYRTSGTHTGALRRSWAFNEADQIRVTVFDNTTQIRTEERKLIRLHRPRYNTHFNSFNSN
jgi:excinuclease UvrABC nuclease subunit